METLRNSKAKKVLGVFLYPIAKNWEFEKSTSDQKLFEQKPQFRLSDATQQRFVTGKKLNI